jgi:AraC-like DNA-binding protein
MHPKLSHIKFVLMTDSVLTAHDMKAQNITVAADDYLAKPFNLQEAIMRFNKLLGLGPIEIDTNLIEGAETRMLEDRNASMTTATETIDASKYREKDDSGFDHIDDEMKMAETHMYDRNTANWQTAGEQGKPEMEDELRQDTLSDYSMLETIDQQLMKNIEQYVLQNMSRGQISLEEMAMAMGMGRVPFFHKIRNLTGKTPTELVRDLRLKHACILLKRTNINMSELATNVGFMTAENFINVFKEKFGLSPLEYRLKHRM